MKQQLGVVKTACPGKRYRRAKLEILLFPNPLVLDPLMAPPKDYSHAAPVLHHHDEDIFPRRCLHTARCFAHLQAPPTSHHAAGAAAAAAPLSHEDPVPQIDQI